VSGLRPVASCILDRALSYSDELCRPDTFCKEMVHSTVRVELNDCFAAGLVIVGERLHLAWHCAMHHSICYFSRSQSCNFQRQQLRLEVETVGGKRDASGLLALRKKSNLTLASVLWGNVTFNVLLTLLPDSVLAS